MSDSSIQSIIEHQLKSAGVRNKSLLEELSDHYYCELEVQLEQGQTLQKAQEHVIATIKSKNYRPLNRQIFFIHHKNQIIMSTLCAVFLSIFTLFSVQGEMPNDPPKLPIDPPSIWPIEPSVDDISSGYGYAIHPFSKKRRFHKGIDIRAKVGTAIMAPADATVVEAGYDDKRGNYIILKHDDIYTTRYNHLSEIRIKKGATVKQGEVIGKVGSTGLSTGPHLHYEVLKNNKHVDPIEFLKA